jgi:prepilin-type N-terminal cleavage/methylation domain-containing protein
MSFETSPRSFRIARTGAVGSSLIEMLICLSIMGIITTGMYSFFLATNQSYGDQAVISRSLWTANDAMKNITQDIRRAGISLGLAPSCALLLSAAVSASNAAGGSLTTRVVLDDPARRIELASNQSKANGTFSVVSTTGYQAGDVAFLTDGTQCTRFTVTGLTGGLQHDTARDSNTIAAGTPYTYSATTSTVYRQGLSQQITYAIDASDPKTSWLTRNAGAGARRLVPDVQAISISYLMADGTSVPSPTTGLPDISTINTPAAAANVRSVTITVTVRADTPSREGKILYRTRAITSSVKLRNLGL